MKKYIYTLLVLLVTTFSNAQRISVSSQMEKIGEEYQNAYRLFIPHATTRTVTKEWSGFLKDYKAKVKASDGQVIGLNARIPSVYHDTLQVFSKITQDPEGTILFVAFLADETAITPTSHPSESESINRLLHDFALPLSKKGLENKIDDAEKAFNSSVKSSEELSRHNERLAADIEKMKDQIRDNEIEIKKNQEKISSLKSQISDQKTSLDNIKLKEKELE
jgi:hypothetical protein